MIVGASRLSNHVRPWWAQRTARERILIGAMALALGGYLLAVWAVQPLLASRSEALATIAQIDRALAQLASSPESVAAQPAAISDQPVTTIVTETAVEFGMTIRRIETEAAGARLSIDDAAFDNVLRWIEGLETDHGLRVVAVEMDRRPEPGMVSASLTVAR